MAILHKQLELEEALQYIAFAILKKDLPEGFDGDITCEMNDDGSVEIYVTETEDKETSTSYN